MAFSIKDVPGLLKQTFKEFAEDDCPRMAAALAYYMVFSMPPLLVLIIAIAGVIWGAEAVEGQIEGQISSLIGQDAAEQVQTMIKNASQNEDKGTVATILGIVALLFGATGAFIQLQAALNKAWEVRVDPDEGGIKNFITKRILSFGMILGIAFLLLVSLALSAALSAFGDMLGDLGGLSSFVIQIINFVISLGVITVLFAAIFKLMPDAEIAWRDVWVGAAITSLLFVIGKFLIGLYLGNSDVGSAYGTAGSLALILVWIYYSSMILFIGAEFTQIWAQRYGDRIRPDEGAVRIEDGTGDDKQPEREKKDSSSSSDDDAQRTQGEEAEETKNTPRYRRP